MSVQTCDMPFGWWRSVSATIRSKAMAYITRLGIFRETRETILGRFAGLDQRDLHEPVTVLERPERRADLILRPHRPETLDETDGRARSGGERLHCGSPDPALRWPQTKVEASRAKGLSKGSHAPPRSGRRRGVIHRHGSLDPAGRVLYQIRPRSRGREAEGGGLLNRYTGVNPYRGFESLRLRHFQIFSLSNILSGCPIGPPASFDHVPSGSARGGREGRRLGPSARSVSASIPCAVGRPCGGRIAEARDFISDQIVAQPVRAR